MPHWVWTALVLVVVAGLFAFLLWIGGGEPLDRSDTGGANGDSGFDGHGGADHR